MAMKKLTAAVPDNNNNPTDKRIEFHIDEDLLEMKFEDRFYFQNEDMNFLSQVIIDGKIYVDVRSS